MDEHLSILVSNFDSHSHYEQSQHDIIKNSYGTMISTVSNNEVSNYQPIHVQLQNIPKEIVTVSPMCKMEPDITARNNIKTEYPQMNDVKLMLTPQKRSRGHIDRYNGMTEEEVIQRKLPDYLREGLDLIVVGINPSMTSACVGHHYAGIGNHFWTCITEAGLVQEQVTCYDDYRMVDYGMGFTNVCSRPTKGAAEISRKEMKAGALIMLEKMRNYRPKIAVFNGKGIYEAFVGHKNFYMGKQPKTLDGTDIMIFVMPSSSARCAQLPRAEDKLPFFVALRKLRDFIKGRLTHLNDQEVIFTDYTEFRVTQPDPKSLRKAERRRKRKAEQMLTLPGTDQLFGLNKPRKNRALMNTMQSQKSNSIASTKENDYGVSTQDLTPNTLPDDSSSQIEIPIAVLNQSTGLISLLPSDFLINGSLCGFNIANQNSILSLNNKNNNSLSTGKPIILQQDASGQMYMLATSSPMLHNTSLSVPQVATLSAANQQSSGSLMPWGGNTTFALIQPSQLINSNQNNSNEHNSPSISWNGSNISVQASPQIISQPSNLLYQKNNTSSSPQQIICSAATLQQLLQQQQSQSQQIQIVNPLSFSQPITIQAPMELFSGNNFGNIQFQQIANCISESLSGDQMSNGGNDQLLQQDSICQVTCSMASSSADNSVSVTNGNIQSINAQNLQSNSTNNDIQSNGPTILGYSLAPQSQSNQSVSLGANQNNNHNLTLAYISNQSSLQNISPTFQSLNNGNTTHIVIPISGTNLMQAGNIIQLSDQQQQRLLYGHGSNTGLVNCFAACGSVTNGVVNNNAISSSDSSSKHVDLTVSNSCNMNNQMQITRPMVSSSSTSAISSIAGQTDLDIISSSSGIGDIYHQHCSAPVQLADCEDQLVQCSSSDEKMIYAAL